jgi:hypothetical protein
VPTTYPYREYVERGGLMAHASDLTELGRRVADDVHQSGNKESEHDCIKLPAKHGCRDDHVGYLFGPDEAAHRKTMGPDPDREGAAGEGEPAGVL